MAQEGSSQTRKMISSFPEFWLTIFAVITSIDESAIVTRMLCDKIMMAATCMDTMVLHGFHTPKGWSLSEPPE